MFNERISHDELKKLNTEQLKKLASEIRSFIVESVSKTGGHLASNLGVVELTIALHRTFDIDKNDKIIWDVGHQSYTHKILTGRADKFNTLRKYGGLSGFPKFSEDERDVFNTGHSSTSISAAVGIAVANELKGIDAKSIAVIGDGAMSGGMAYEALNHAGHITKNLIIVYNDNDMSISKSVGGFSKAMKRLRNANKYLKFKDDFKTALDNIPVVGAPTKKGITRVKSDLKNIVIEGNVVFEGMGFTYMGPVDGHNFDELITVFEHAKLKNEPVFIHVYTKKGKGYKPAEINPGIFHGVGSFDVKTGVIFKPTDAVSWSELFGDTVCKLAAQNKNIAAVTAAMPSGTGLNGFAKKFPDRFFDVGIAEQHAVTFSAGLARAGMTPIFAVYSTFLQRAYDQILHDVSFQKLHTVFAVDRSGPVGCDGETHQGVYDISYLSHMPNMIILSPAIDEDFEPMLDYLVNKQNGPGAIRYPRGSVCVRSDIKGCCIPKLNTENCLRPRIIDAHNFSDVLIISVGVMLKNASEAKIVLEERGYTVSLVDAVCVKPFDVKAIEDLAAGANAVVTIENNVEIGGFGQMLESLLKRDTVKFAYPDEPIVQGRVSELEERYGLTPKQIADRIISYLG